MKNKVTTVSSMYIRIDKCIFQLKRHRVQTFFVETIINFSLQYQHKK